MEQKTNLITLAVEVSDIIYQNEANGYTVFEFEADGLLQTATGIVPGLYVGEQLKISGQWCNHQTYGEQFKVLSFEKSMPSDSTTMLKYLASGAIRGVGPKIAERIIEKFGDDTFSVLESQPEALSTIKGISKARAREISTEFNSQFGMRNVMIFFSEFFGPTLTSKIYKNWGSASVDLVKSNPYVLCTAINGIGFQKADDMAMSFGIPKDSTERIEAALTYVLKQDSAVSGNLYLKKDRLCDLTCKLLDIDKERVIETIENLCTKNLLVAFDFNTMSNASPNVNSCIYLPTNLHIEKSIAYQLVTLSKFETSTYFTNIQEIINSVEEMEGIKYAPSQRNAITDALNNSVYILTGGPGTGKTTIIRAIIKIYANLGLKYLLAAPTGRAAKRMSESTLCEAKTIHRLLEYEFSDDDDGLNFQRDESNPLDTDVVIIDEASMIDAPLFFSLLRAIRPSTRLLLIGDANQLPSVGAGNVLSDIIKSGIFKVGMLNEIFRQEDGSSIVINAHKINNGNYPDLSNASQDFFFMPRSTGESVANTICQLYQTRLPAKYGEAITDDIQILCPTKKGECGTINLNKKIQQIKNPASPEKTEIKLRDFILREGDRVMQIKNNYDVFWTKESFLGDEENGYGIFNGDIGIVESIDVKDEFVNFIFDDKRVTYSFHNLEEIELAYAVTIHKSQGSEYPLIIIPISSVSSLLMSRNLLYTAITRAQKMVIIVGAQELIKQMVDNNSQSKRNTGLTAFLKGENETF